MTSKNNNSNHDPLNWRTIVSGIIITVIGGVILAFILQDARFGPEEPEERFEEVVLDTSSDEPLQESEDEPGEPIPLPTPTAEPLPTSTSPSPTKTAVPTLEPSIHVDPETLIPDSEIPDYFIVDFETETSNEYVAELRDDPAEFYQLIEDWEREGGYYRYWVNEEGCDSILRFRELTLQSVILGSIEGANNYWNWLLEEEPSDAEIISVEALDDIGERSTIRWSVYDDDCEPASELLNIDLRFQRYNAFGSIHLSGVKATISEEDLEQLAIRLAQLMDLKFLSNTNQ
ncbi:MAG: hypothetical protein DHS20C20_29260 [Ardenticatenaceae bacterium]|nr:MAG: hypothetical protein DHS20C20_29260 [Ardenticatenaceae bacterium]